MGRVHKPKPGDKTIQFLPTYRYLSTCSLVASLAHTQHFAFNIHYPISFIFYPFRNGIPQACGFQVGIKNYGALFKALFLHNTVGRETLDDVTTRDLELNLVSVNQYILLVVFLFSLRYNYLFTCLFLHWVISLSFNLSFFFYYPI